MNGRAKEKMVTSGRLTGSVKGSCVTPDPEPAARPKLVYSLYSSDSEDQVTSLHKGLDHCAALLGGILQAERAASPGLSRTPRRITTKSRASNLQGKKIMKKLPTKTASSGLTRTAKAGAAKSRPSTSQGKMATRKLLATDHRPAMHESTPPAADSEGKLRPSRKRAPPRPPAQNRTPPPQTSVQVQTDRQSVPDAPRTRSKSERDGDGDVVPVRDTNIQASVDGNPRTAMRSNQQPELRQECKVLEDTSRSGEPCSRTETKSETVRCLLGELKTLIAGQGSVAERLLSRLERIVSSPQLNVPELPLTHSQNSQLFRCVRTDDEELHGKAGKHQKQEMLCSSEVESLQEELIAAQSRLQELQDDFTELRRALQDTHSQLRDAEAENALIKTDLKATRNRLHQTEKQKSELASLAQRRLDEMDHLKRLLQSRASSEDRDVRVLRTLTEQRFSRRQDPAVPSADRIEHYLMSLNQTDLTHTEPVSVAAERDENAPDLRDTSHRQQSDKPSETSALQQNPHLSPSSSEVIQPCGRQLERASRQLFDASQCDAGSVCSNWSMRSGSTFNTRDELVFRDGLAALDASIASLQKTIQLDLKR